MITASGTNDKPFSSLSYLSVQTKQERPAVRRAVPQPVEKPGLCIKYKPGFWRIEAKEVQV